MVRSVDDAGRRLLIVTVMAEPGRNLDVGQFPIPACCSLIDAEALLGPTGYLAIPRSPEDEEPAEPGVFVYDIATFDAPPLYFGGGSGGFAWAPDGRLAILDAETITVVDPADGSVLVTVAVPAGVIVASDLNGHGVWAADGSGLLAGRVGVASTDRGILGLDGAFVMEVAPAVFAPTGRERPFDTGGRSLTMGCDPSAAGARQVLCTVSAAPIMDGELEGLYSGNDVRDFLWTADGRAIWLVTGDGDRSETERIRLRRGMDESFEDITGLTTDSAGAVSDLTLWGVSADDRVVALNAGLGPQDREAMTHVRDLDTGDEWGLSGVFAGWASQEDAIYDPASS